MSITKSSERKQSVLVIKTDRIRDVSVLMKGLPHEKMITEAIRDMNEDVLDRDQIEKILKLLTFIDEIDQLQRFCRSNPDSEGSLDKAERFLLSIGSIPNVEAKLSFWKFRLDCEASEDALCRPVSQLLQVMELLRSNQNFKMMLSLILKSGNFLNQTSVKAFNLNDLQKITQMKDQSKTKSLLYHVVRKALEIDPTFDGFDETFVSGLEDGATTDFDQVASDLEVMERECKKSLKFVLLQRNENVDLLDFIKEVVERVVTLKKILSNLNSKFLQFLTWLGMESSEHQKPNDLCKTLLEFSLESNKLLEEIKKESRRANSQNYETETDSNRSLRKVPFYEMEPQPINRCEAKAGVGRKDLEEVDGGRLREEKEADEDELLKVLVSGFKERKTIRRRRPRKHDK